MNLEDFNREIISISWERPEGILTATAYVDAMMLFVSVEMNSITYNIQLNPNTERIFLLKLNNVKSC